MDKKCSFAERVNDPTTFYLTISGSRAYGTNTLTSDVDYKGIYLPAKDTYKNPVEQYEFNEPDAVIYSVKKFLGLLVENNPNIIEMLWTEEEDVAKIDERGRYLREIRESFLTKKVVHTFTGYAHAQLKRMETHRKWLLNPPTKKPDRKDFLLPEMPVVPKNQLDAAKSKVTKKMDSWAIDFGPDVASHSKIYIMEQISDYLSEIEVSRDEKFILASRILGFEENFIEYMDKERRFEAASKEWKDYNTWLNERNESRFIGQVGYDCKNGYHLIRLLTMACEILETGNVVVKRPDANIYLDIRNGLWEYDRIMQYADELKSKTASLVKTCMLPNNVDSTFVENVYQRIVTL